MGTPLGGRGGPGAAAGGPARPRFREQGFRCGRLEPGPQNAITDVPDVVVGHVTKIAGDGPLEPGRGPVRTGVTAVRVAGRDLYAAKAVAACHVINGFGKAAGLAQLEELGTLETPILLTSTLAVPRAADALVGWVLDQHPELGVRTVTVNPVVGECSDAYLNDIRGRHITEADVRAALDGATDGPVAEGAVGAGTGMRAFGYKGGIGTASRRVRAERAGVPAGPAWTLGALVLANFGRREDLTVCGVPVGRVLAGERGGRPAGAGDPAPPAPDGGSIVVVLATDAPLDARALGRVARRAALGIARTGGFASHSSGDFCLAFSVANPVPHEPPRPLRTVTVLADEWLDPLFLAAVEATEEAVYNALWRATPMVGRDGHRVDALPVDRVAALLDAAGHPRAAGVPP